MRTSIYRFAPFLIITLVLITACQATPTQVPPAATEGALPDTSAATLAPATETPTSALSTAIPASNETPTPWPVLGPEATEDRVGFPEGYNTDFETLYVFDRPDNKQVRKVYANPIAATVTQGEPFPYGSILVMETYRAILDPEDNLVLDEHGRFQAGELRGIFVMRKESGFGTRYQAQRTGEWEYVAFRPDGTFLSEPQNSVGCAACHTDAGPARDWVYRADLSFTEAGGGLPQLPPNHPTDQLIIDSYLFLPNDTRIKAGTTLTWNNNDQVPHTVTASDGSFSSLIQQGRTFSQTFDEVGTFEYFCAIHPRMKAVVIVEE